MPGQSLLREEEAQLPGQEGEMAEAATLAITGVGGEAETWASVGRRAGCLGCSPVVGRTFPAEPRLRQVRGSVLDLREKCWSEGGAQGHPVGALCP